MWCRPWAPLAYIPSTVTPFSYRKRAKLADEQVRLSQPAHIELKMDCNAVTFCLSPPGALLLGFTAFPFEDVGTLINHSNADLYMFASDYPHIEGGRDPLGSFDGYLAAHSTDTHQRSSLKTLGEFWGVRSPE